MKLRRDKPADFRFATRLVNGGSVVDDFQAIIGTTLFDCFEEDLILAGRTARMFDNFLDLISLLGVECVKSASYCFSR